MNAAEWCRHCSIRRVDRNGYCTLCDARWERDIARAEADRLREALTNLATGERFDGATREVAQAALQGTEPA